MSAGQDEFVTIRPRQVALSRQQDKLNPVRGRSIGVLLVGAGATLLIAIGVWVFLYLPGRSAPPAADPVQAANTAAPKTQPETQPAPTVVATAPYAALQIDRERKRAQETLARFVRLQIKLDEEMHVRAWAVDQFDAAQQLANDGDALFTKQQFEDAMGNYEKGIVSLETLRVLGEARFNDAMTAATHAIDQRDPAAAEAAYTIAASVFPDDARIVNGRARVQQLPAIVELFDEADRAVERNDWRAALAKYRAIQNVDPKTQGLQTALNDAQARVADLDFQGLLTTGYAALDTADYGAAKRAFDGALRQRPDDAAARDGMNQVEQRSTLSSIEEFHQQATRAEDEERWKEAVANYRRVLTVDASIKFAKDGEARAGARSELDQKLNTALADPGLLSSDETYAETALLYETSIQIASPGPRLTDQLNRLEKQLSIAREPVPVTLTSDSITEVTLSQVGALGKFNRKEVRLRPGRYVLIGSRDGRRDVRRQLDVTPRMPPVEISCQEAI